MCVSVCLLRATLIWCAIDSVISLIWDVVTLHWHTRTLPLDRPKLPRSEMLPCTAHAAHAALTHTLLLLLLPLTIPTETPAHLNGDPPVHLLRLTGLINTP